MVRAAALILALLLSGCERSVYAGWTGERTAETADLARVNGANALERVNDLTDQVEEMKSQIDTLKTENERLARLIEENYAADRRSFGVLDDSLDTHDTSLREINARLGL